MKKLKVKAPAKINLTLDVLGVDGGYHQINSLVTSIDLYDYITIKKRNDNNITLKTRGLDVKCSEKDNNAYKSAVKFMQTFNTHGVDLIIDKKIPVGAGLGGSSADIAGLLNAIKKLYGVRESVKNVADELGSDSSYMLKGGWAVLSGRGDEQEFLQIDFPLYLVIVIEDKGVSAKECYGQFDKQNKIYARCTKKAVLALKNGNFKQFCALAKNDLEQATARFVPEIQSNINALKQAGANLALMTGSGSAVIGVFDNRKERDKVYKKLKGKYGKRIIKCKTI